MPIAGGAFFLFQTTAAALPSRHFDAHVCQDFECCLLSSNLIPTTEEISPMQSQSETTKLRRGTSHEDNGPHFIAWRCDRSELSIHVAGFDEQIDGEMLLSWSPEVGVEIGEAHDTRTFWRTLDAPFKGRFEEASQRRTARNRLHLRISAAISSENARILRVNWSAMSSNFLATCRNLLII